MLKRAAHGILAADGANAKGSLRFVCAKERRHRLAPALRIVLRALKVFLEGEPAFFIAAADGNRLCN